MKKYWIEKLEYPQGLDGFVDCVSYGEDSYSDKGFALQEFMDCINSIEDKTTCVALYEIETNPGEAYFKQFYNDIERIYQLLFANAKNKSTTLSGGSGNNTSSVTHKWFDGICDEFTINEFEEGEEEIDGLNVCRFIFNCKIMRVN